MQDSDDPAALPTPLAPAGDGALGPVWDALADRAAHYATRARGDGTRRTYRSAWTHFCRWCDSLGRTPLGGDPDLVAMYIVRRADDGLAVSSIRVALAAIRTAHQLAGVGLDLSQPRFRMTLEGVVRSRGVRPTRQAAPAVPDVLAEMLATLPSPDSPLGIRKRAMLLLGFGAALRRSELVGLRLGDVQLVPGRGLTVLVQRSKTDQHGRGQQVAIWANPANPLACPAASLERWLTVRQTAPDILECFGADARDTVPLFCGMSKAGRLSGAALSDKAVARLVKTAAAVAGLDPERYSGHSLRVAAVEAGVPTPDISTPADIAAARDRAGLPSLAALAAQLGVSRQTLHSWGRTSRVPSWVSLACAGLIAQAGRPLT